MALPDVFMALGEDRHTDPEMLVFERQEDAVSWAVNFAQENSRDGQFTLETLTAPMVRAGWVYYATYGEGNSVRVQKSWVR